MYYITVPSILITFASIIIIMFNLNEFCFKTEKKTVFVWFEKQSLKNLSNANLLNHTICKRTPCF